MSLENFAKKRQDLGQILSYLRIFGLEFLKIIVIFEISTIKLFYLETFDKKLNILKFGQKMPYLAIFEL